jgi:hypothetical protein
MEALRIRTGEHVASAKNNVANSIYVLGNRIGSRIIELPDHSHELLSAIPRRGQHNHAVVSLEYKVSK